MQRYSFGQDDSGVYKIVMRNDGAYVYFEDAQSRISQLEAALRNIALRVRKVANTKPERGTWRSDVLAEIDKALGDL